MMMTIGQYKNGRKYVLSLVLALAFIFGFFYLGGVRYSGTPSLPKGFYRITSDGNLVVFCGPQWRGQSLYLAGYVKQGVCADGSAPLLKPVVAKSGDVVSLSSIGIEVNGVLLKNTVAAKKDGQGRPMQHWPYGEYFVTEGQFWVVSDYSAESFDSRYFGPIKETDVIHKMRPLWVY